MANKDETKFGKDQSKAATKTEEGGEQAKSGDIFDKEADEARELAHLEKEEELAKREAALKEREDKILAAEKAAKTAKSPAAALAAPAVGPGKRSAFHPGEILVKAKVAPRRSVDLGGATPALPGSTIHIPLAEKERLKKLGFVVEHHEHVDTEADVITGSLETEGSEAPQIKVGVASNRGHAPGVVATS